MARNATGQGSEIRHRLDPQTSTAPSQSASRSSPALGGRRGVVRLKDKGKKRAFGWGLGQDAWVEEKFRRFGEHCARNQIRTLLLDCLVMTNLFYPSLAIYLSKRFPPPSSDSPFAQPRAGPSRATPREHPLSILTTRLLDSFFPYPPPLLPRLAWTGWWDDTPPDPEDGAWFLDRPDGEMEWLEEEVRVMRIAWADVGDVLDGPGASERSWAQRDHTILGILREMAEGWEESGGGQRCVRSLEDQRCMLFSPDELDEEAVQHIQLPPAAKLRTEDIYRGVVVPFHVPRGELLEFERRWAEGMGALGGVAQAELFGEARVTGRGADNSGAWLLTFQSESLPPPTTLPTVEPTLSPSPSKFVYLLYLALFSVLGHQISNASKVHSRFGLAFTGCVQLCCSSVMSFSILALLGWNGWGVSMEPTTLPTYILPFVVTVVGAENMSTLTKAVFSVPFTYSVPARIGLALSKVGTSISITSLSDLVLLGVVWFVANIRPVREFCVFAAVLIVTDWFMLNTFFLTILSIDAQRLELADVLASSDGTASPTDASQKAKQGVSDSPRQGWKKFIQARTAKSGSLIAILCCVGIIYYLTERHRLPATAATLYGYDPTSTAYQPPLRPTPTPLDLASSPHNTTSSQNLWHAINPDGWPSIRISLPPASIFVLPRTGHAMAPSSLRDLAGNRPRSPYPRIKPLLHAIKVLILPQAVTAFALWGILLYLLKDKDLLDAQRNKLGRGESEPLPERAGKTATTSKLASKLQVRMLPCTPASDVEIVVASADGKLVLTISLDNSVHLWRFTETEGGGTRERLDLELEDTTAVIAAATFCASGRWAAVVTRGGTVQIWEVVETGSAKLVQTRSATPGGRICEIAFQPISRDADDPFIMSRQSSATDTSPPPVLVIMADGSVVSLDDSSRRTLIPSSGNVARAHLIPDATGERCDIVAESSSGIDLWRASDSGWDAISLHSTRMSRDRLTASQAFRLNRGSYGTIYAFGYASGLVEIFDTGGTLLIVLHHPETITALYLSAPKSSRCTTCSSVLTAGFFVVACTATQTHVDLVHPRSNSGLCRCASISAPPRRSASGEDYPSSTPSYTASPVGKSGVSLVIPPSPARRSTPGNSPRRSPSLLPPVSNGEFPLSSHGTRRYSSLHRDDGPEQSGAASQDSVSWSDLDFTSLGAIATAGGGGSALLGQSRDRLVALHRAGTGIDDSSWLVLSLDLAAPWNGTTLVVDSASLSVVQRRTAAKQIMGETSMRARRTERLLSLSGRMTFPSLSAGGSGGAALGGGLAYVGIRPVRALGTRGVVGGFGNRLGVVTLEEDGKGKEEGHKEVGVRREGGDGGLGNGVRAKVGSAVGVTGSPFLVPPPLTFGNSGSSSKKAL